MKKKLLLLCAGLVVAGLQASQKYKTHSLNESLYDFNDYIKALWEKCFVFGFEARKAMEEMRKIGPSEEKIYIDCNSEIKDLCGTKTALEFELKRLAQRGVSPRELKDSMRKSFKDCASSAHPRWCAIYYTMLKAKVGFNIQEFIDDERFTLRNSNFKN